jgi:hypothetical protein
MTVISRPKWLWPVQENMQTGNFKEKSHVVWEWMHKNTPSNIVMASSDPVDSAEKKLEKTPHLTSSAFYVMNSRQRPWLITKLRTVEEGQWVIKNDNFKSTNTLQKCFQFVGMLKIKLFYEILCITNSKNQNDNNLYSCKYLMK